MENKKRDATIEALELLTDLLIENAPDDDSRNKMLLLKVQNQIRNASIRILEQYGNNDDVAPEDRKKALDVLQSAAEMLNDLLPKQENTKKRSTEITIMMKKGDE